MTILRHILCHLDEVVRVCRGVVVCECGRNGMCVGVVWYVCEKMSDELIGVGWA